MSAFQQAFPSTVNQPFQQIPVLLVNRIQDTVYALGHKRFLVQFHLVGRELSDFSGKGLERPLEELINGTHRKSTVIMQDIRQDFRSFPLDGLQRIEALHQIIDVV